MTERYFQQIKTFFKSTAIKTLFSRYFECFKTNGADTREAYGWGGKDVITPGLYEVKACVDKRTDSRLAFQSSCYGQSTTEAGNTVVSEN